jgi:caffeoyl-CoA O-methyltransferase
MTATASDRKTARPVTPLGILVQQLENILQQAEAENLSPELKTSLQNAYHLAAGIDPYIERYSTPESEDLAKLAKKTQQEDWSKRFSDGETVRQLEQEMLSGQLEGQVLKMFVRMTGAKRILEVGMFTGYSALAMAEALPEDGLLVACEVDPYVTEFARECFQSSPHRDKISIAVAPALETLQKLAETRQSFDLVFIDADKKEYVDYFRLLLDADLLAPDGYICVDNTLLQGQVYANERQRSANGDAIARFNRIVAEDPRVEQVILPLRDGLTIIRRKDFSEQ